MAEQGSILHRGDRNEFARKLHSHVSPPRTFAAFIANYRFGFGVSAPLLQKAGVFVRRLCSPGIARLGSPS